MDKFMYYQEHGHVNPRERKLWLNKQQMETIGFWTANVLLVVMVTFVHFTTK